MTRWWRDLRALFQPPTPHRTEVCTLLKALKPLVEPDLAAKMTHGPLRRAQTWATKVAYWRRAS